MVRRIGLVQLRQFWGAAAIAAFAGISLAPADISAHAQTRDDQPASSLDLGARGGLTKQTSAPTAAPSDRQESSAEFSARAGLATDYIYRGTTLSAHQPAVGAVFEAAFNHFYAGAGLTTVKLPSEPAAEIAMSTGVRPSIGNVDLDLGWTYYLYPSSGTTPVGTTIDINYWEFVARADSSFGEALHIATGSGFSPNYSNTGAWSNYTAFGVGLQLPRNSLPRDLTASVTGGAGYFWFGNQSAALGGFPLPAYLNWNAGVTFSQKNVNFDLRYYDTNLSKEQCFVLTGDMTGGFGGRIDLVTNPEGRISNWCNATIVAKFWFALN
jgi:uncharacterized protein (TIGR02001 family)